MATPQENLARFQEIARRGLQDRLDPDKRARFDEAVRRGLIAVDQPPSEPVRTGRGIGAGDRSSPGVVALLEEAAAAVNRGAVNVAEFFTTDQINGLARLLGKGPVVTDLSDQDFVQPFIEPQITEGMEPGLGRDVVRTAGELAAPGAAVGGVMRTAGRAIPAIKPLAAGSPTADIAASAASGAGAEIGEDVGGDAGRLVGSIALPVAGGAAISAAQRGVQGARASIPAQERALLDQADDAGVPLLTSDVKPPQTFVGKTLQQTSEKIPIAGTGPVRELQQRMRQNAVDKVADKYGEYSYDAIVQSLKTQKNRVKSAAGTVLDDVGRSLDEVGQIPTTATGRAIAQAQDELSKSNVIQSSNAIDDLNTLLNALEQPQTFTSLKENRTAFREIVNSTDKADRSQLTSRAKAMLNRVYDGMTKDMEQFAKQNLDDRTFGRWQRANAVYADEANKLTRTKLKNVLDKGDVTPEQVQSLLFSRKPSEQKLLYDSLTSDGRKNARAAIISKVVDNVSRRANGMTPNSFVNELKKYPDQIKTFFKGEERRQLEGLMRVLEATARAQDAAIATPTGQSIIPLLTGASLYANTAATAGIGGSLGGLARLYESAPVRNALLKLGSVPKDSKGYAQALINAQIALQAATSAGSDQEEQSRQPTR